MANPIIVENQNTGTTAWIGTQQSVTQIQAYADKVSYNPGDTVSMYVSTQVASTTYTITIYRLGWYGGTGGCLKYTSTTSTGIAQGYWNSTNTTLNNCPTAISDSTTHNLEAGWTVTDTWVIPGGAVTGLYRVILTDVNGYQSAIFFIVKGNTSADYLYQHSAITDQAYNDWGGYGLYTNPTVGVKVSFNRPISAIYCWGSGASYQMEVAGIKWLEKQGCNLSYISDIDMHVNAAQLKNYKAVLYAGHNEYWTKEMRDGAEAAISAGVSAAFLGANTSYWQARLGVDAASVANRSITCYKVTPAFPNNLTNDPFYNVDNTRVTCKWRDSPVSRPENSMIGIMYSGAVANGLGNNATWTTDASMDTTYNAGTGLVANTSYGSDLVGYEWDKIQSGSPAGLKTIATSTISSDTSNTTFYKASSGALVFATGSMAWTWSLDTFRHVGGSVAVIPGMQLLFGNIMGALKGPVFSMVSV